MTSTEAWLKNFFAERAPLPPDVETVNYFEAGLIESFGVIELIEAVERHFSVTFEPGHFEQRRFATIRGLAEIIEELRHA